MLKLLYVGAHCDYNKNINFREEFIIMKEFEKYLRESNLSENTVTSYVTAVKQFFLFAQELNRNNLLAFKGYLLERYKPKTVNLRIQAINKYLEFVGKDKLRLQQIKLQQKTYLENVISNADYKYLADCLFRDGNWTWYFVVRYLAATGARVGELVQLKAEHVFAGYYDIYSKGGKIRRLYIPRQLREETLNWLRKQNIEHGFLFRNRSGGRLTTRGIAQELKIFAVRYGVNPQAVYPHSFRHRFAKNFLEKYNDIALLADLMGHDSIETTRIYLRKTTSEQREIVDEVVTW